MKKVRLMSLLVLLSATAVAWAAPAAGGGRSHAEAPMQVATEGMTAEEGLQQQAETSRWLAGELPGALESVRVPLALDEAAAVEAASRTSVPMKIGLVKAMIPGIEVFSLIRGQADGQARRGSSGVAFPTADRGFVWATEVVAENAGAIRLHVEGLSLPRSAALYVYTRDGQARGPYFSEGPNGTGEFWTPAVFGSEAILQIRLSGPGAEADLRNVTLRVTEAGLITQGLAGDLRRPIGPTPEFCGNIPCLIDATCPSTATPANPAKLAVAKMEWVQGAFIYTCTGGLISDNNPAQNNFFLTANHCVSKNNAAGNVDFFWRFATSSCNGACPSNNGWPFVTSGSTVSKTGRKGDFSLLHLNSNPPAGSVFLGWTSAPVANSNNTPLYRISNPNFGPQVYSQHNVSTTAGTCSGWPRGERIYSKDIMGAIDGGSSGSPVLNGSSQIVGQLSGICGTNVNDACDEVANATVDGAFAFYFALVQPILAP